MSGEGRDFLFDRGETPGARRIRTIAVAGALLAGGSGSHSDQHEHRQERRRHNAADIRTDHAGQYRT
jgi:hypothetical protein